MITDEQGANMIIALQRVAGIDEPYEQALENWRRMADWEKQSTTEAYQIFCPKEDT
jgi:hypothetical protein